MHCTAQNLFVDTEKLTPEKRKKTPRRRLRLHMDVNTLMIVAPAAVPAAEVAKMEFVALRPSESGHV